MIALIKQKNNIPFLGQDVKGEGHCTCNAKTVSTQQLKFPLNNLSSFPPIDFKLIEKAAK